MRYGFSFFASDIFGEAEVTTTGFEALVLLNMFWEAAYLSACALVVVALAILRYSEVIAVFKPVWVRDEACLGRLVTL